MTRRRPKRPPDLLVDAARCDPPLPALWEWREALETFAVHDRLLERDHPFGVQNGEDVRAPLFEVQKRTRIEDVDAIPLPAHTPPPEIILPEHGFSPDFFWSNSLKFASRRLRDALALSSDVVEFTPAILLEGGEDARARDYNLMRVHAIQPAIDVNLSDCEPRQLDHWLTGRPLLRLRMVRQVVLRADLQPRTDLFRVDEDPVTLLATDALVLRVLEAGLSGIEFRDPGVSDWGMHYQRLRTLTGVRLRPKGFDRWPPPPGVHVPILGWSPEA